MMMVLVLLRVKMTVVVVAIMMQIIIKEKERLCGLARTFRLIKDVLTIPMITNIIALGVGTDAEHSVTAGLPQLSYVICN